MSFRLRVPTLLGDLFSATKIRHAAYWGRCAHCHRTTAWQVGAVRGEYRCTACGHSALTGE